MPDPHRLPHFAIRLDDEDRALLDAVARHEKLTKSDVLRRGLREYAARLGVKQPRPKAKK
jgi:predicted transcriptional regulator